VTSATRDSRPPRTEQLYLWGPTGIGKSYLFNVVLQPYLRIYKPLPSVNFYDEYDDDAYDLILMDEFNGASMSITDLNKFVEGYSVPLNRKGICPVHKNKNLPVVIISNNCLADHYSNFLEKNKLVAIFKALEARFTHVHMEKKIEITPFESDILVPGTPDDDVRHSSSLC